MSGGYFDYLCYKEPSMDIPPELGDMITEAEAEGYASFAAALKRIRECLWSAQNSIRNARELWQVLAPVMKEYEWWKSNDSSREDFEEEMRRWLTCSAI